MQETVNTTTVVDQPQQLRFDVTYFDGDVIVHTDHRTVHELTAACLTHQLLDLVYELNTLRGGFNLVVDPATARMIAQAWAAQHRRSPDVRWGHEVVALMRAAALADAQRRVTFPDAAIVRRLHLVAQEPTR